MEQVKAEPVAWMQWNEREPHHGKDLEWRPLTAADKAAGWTETPLYATPQPAAVDGLVEAAKRYVADFEGDFCLEGVIVDDPDPLLKLHYISLRQALAQIERKPEDGNG